jgi:hypothetical protein
MKRFTLPALAVLATLLALGCSGDSGSSEDQPSMTDVLGVQAGIEAAELTANCLIVCRETPPDHGSTLAGVQRVEGVTSEGVISQEVVDRCSKVIPCQARAGLK